MKKLLLTVLAFAAVGSFCFAQKLTSKTMTITYSVSPTNPPPADNKNVTYTPMLVTPLAAFPKGEGSSDTKTKLNELAKSDLKINSSRYLQWESGADWIIRLETGDVAIGTKTDKSWNELEMTDPVFTYTCPAKLSVLDKASGKTVFEKVIGGDAEEQKMPKGNILDNPKFLARYALVKNNPEKLKKLADDAIENTSHVVLLITLHKAANALADAFEDQTRTAHVSLFSAKGKAYAELNDINDKIFETDAKVHALSKKNRIPKSDLDKVMTESIPTWEKYVAEHSELEEEAKKGLILNCALAATMTGDFDKAATYFAKVDEAKKTDNIKEKNDTMSQGPVVATLSFKDSAENLRNMYEYMKEFKSRIKFDL